MHAFSSNIVCVSAFHASTAAPAAISKFELPTCIVAEPLVGRSGGEEPLKLKHFFLLNVQWKLQIRPFLAKTHLTI